MGEKKPKKGQKSCREIWNKKNGLEYRRNYRKRPSERVKRNIRKRVKAAIDGRGCNQIGCSREYLIQHIQSKFKRGMTWENYGAKWHIDHIVPVAKFNLNNAHHRRMVNHYTNLQPLWAKQNMKKSDSFVGTLPLL